MKIIINCPAEDAEMYVEHVLSQIQQGYTSGHVDAESHWDSEKTEAEALAED
jgi:hypothetical protein